MPKFDFEILRQNLTFVSLFNLYVVMAAPRGIVGGNLFWKVVTLIGLHIDCVRQQYLIQGVSINIGIERRIEYRL